MNLFTYYLGPAKGVEDPGWYTLKNRRDAEGEDKDFKPPHPPGDWTIEILATPEWKGSGIESIENIERTGIKIYEIMLEPQ